MEAWESLLQNLAQEAQNIDVAVAKKFFFCRYLCAKCVLEGSDSVGWEPMNL